MEDKITRALRVLMLGKVLRADIKKAEDEAKKELAGVMTPGDRRMVTDNDGNIIGKVTLSAAPKAAPKITDPMALARWCEERGINHGGWESVEFPEWFTAKGNLEGLIGQAGGEIPDGIEIPDEGAPRFSVPRGTAAEDAALDNAVRATLAPLNAFLEVEQ